jgi:hypothetical protein
MHDFSISKGRSPTSTTDGYPDVNESRFMSLVGNKEFNSKYKTTDKSVRFSDKSRPEWVFGVP